jgi:hypothetical protein
MKMPVNGSPRVSSAATRRISWLWLYLLLALPRIASAAEPRPDLTAKFLRAAQTFEQARAGSAEATLLAQAAFQDLLQEEPNNPLFLAYYGSTLAMQARDGHLPWQRVKEIHDSIATVNRALSLLRPEHDRIQIRGMPLSLETRLVAIATFVALPEIFHCMPTAREQLALAMGSPLFASAPQELRGRLFYEAALIAEADGEVEHERAALRQVLASAPASLDLGEVRARLKKLGG